MKMNELLLHALARVNLTIRMLSEISQAQFHKRQTYDSIHRKEKNGKLNTSDRHKNIGHIGEAGSASWLRGGTRDAFGTMFCFSAWKVVHRCFLCEKLLFLFYVIFCLCVTLYKKLRKKSKAVIGDLQENNFSNVPETGECSARLGRM